MKDLTNRDREIITLMAEGFTTKEIGLNMYGQTMRTVDTYRSRLYKKVGVKNAAQLISWAYQHSVLTLDTSMKQQ